MKFMQAVACTGSVLKTSAIQHVEMEFNYYGSCKHRCIVCHQMVRWATFWSFNARGRKTKASQGLISYKNPYRGSVPDNDIWTHPTGFKRSTVLISWKHGKYSGPLFQIKDNIITVNLNFQGSVQCSLDKQAQCRGIAERDQVSQSIFQ